MTIEVNGNDSWSTWVYYSVYWTLTDAAGVHVDLVYDYSQWEAANAYGCLADGCYNFFMYDYGWEPGLTSVDITLGDETTTYTFPEGSLRPLTPLGSTRKTASYSPCVRMHG